MQGLLVEVVERVVGGAMACSSTLVCLSCLRGRRVCVTDLRVGQQADCRLHSSSPFTRRLALSLVCYVYLVAQEVSRQGWQVYKIKIGIKVTTGTRPSSPPRIQIQTFGLLNEMPSCNVEKLAHTLTGTVQTQGPVVLYSTSSRHAGCQPQMTRLCYYHLRGKKPVGSLLGKIEIALKSIRLFH
jgi:hypothetical protein